MSLEIGINMVNFIFFLGGKWKTHTHNGPYLASTLFVFSVHVGFVARKS